MAAGLIGEQIGRYHITEQLGIGGMATVYKADDIPLERKVAIKVIRSEVFSADEMTMLRKRFDREAKSLAGLSHPNIVPVIDYGEIEGVPYLVMVYLSGGTLKDRLGKPIPWREAIHLILPIARALEFVHTRNIIHRDVKPSNILLTENGEPLLTDFGLVKLYTGKDQDTTSITGSGAGVGTPDYMAPEQWTGEATALSDLYSLGVVLYEMITGHRPYVADTPAGILLKQANEPLPLPREYVPDLPDRVESVLLKVLAYDSANRYADMHSFVDELEDLLAGRKVFASTIKKKQLREQMSSAVEQQPILNFSGQNLPPSSGDEPYASSSGYVRKRKRWTVPAFLLSVFGGVILGVGTVSGWVLYTNPGVIPIIIGITPTASVTPSPTMIPPSSTATSTMFLPIETAQPTKEPTATLTPTATPLPEEIEDDNGVLMRLVPASGFTMGSDYGDEASSRPAHEVYLDAFYIDKFEVSNEQYADCVNASGCRRPHRSGSINRSTYFNDPRYANYPVLYLDWGMAKTYCAWRDARLPTEAEWEKAARGTDRRVYPWKSQERSCYFANFSGCVGDTTSVDNYPQGQSPYGVYNLTGNVWEWTSSLFRSYPYVFDDGRENPAAIGKRVARGGSWHTFGVISGSIKNDIRYALDPNYFGGYVGVRCVMDAETK